MGSGRAIHYHFAEIFQLNTVAIAAYDPPGAATTGYDPTFRTPVLVDGGDRIGTVKRLEKTAVQVKVTFTDQVFEALRMSGTGNMPDTKVQMMVMLRDAARVGLVDDDGNCTIRVNDRVGRLLDRFGRTVLTFDRPNLFVSQVSPGIVHSTMHSVVLDLEPRDQGSLG